MLLGYLKRHVKIIVLILLFVVIFAVVFSLYDLPVEAVAYAGVLCFVTGLVFFFIGFFRYRSYHRELASLLDRITVSLDALPKPRGDIEHDYHSLLQALFKEKAHIQTASDAVLRDMNDYYTLWVHQIKTPIAAMRLMLQSSDNSESAALLAELFKIEQYVEMVLQYLRLGSSATDFVIRTAALDDIVRQAVRKYARLFILKKIKLDFTETNLEVLTDEKWLTYVIEQVLSNAVKYTPAGTVSIYADGPSLVIRDTGIGIKPEDLPRVFDRGFTGYNGRADKKSTGIGLYLCRRILRLLGHTITIDSDAGRGTTVTLGFPPAERACD